MVLLTLFCLVLETGNENACDCLFLSLWSTPWEWYHVVLQDDVYHGRDVSISVALKPLFCVHQCKRQFKFTILIQINCTSAEELSFELFIGRWHQVAAEHFLCLCLSLSVLCPSSVYYFSVFFSSICFSLCLSHTLTWLLTTESLHNEVRGVGLCIEDAGQMKCSVVQEVTTGGRD